MPFFKTINIKNGILGIWKLSDTVEDLINQFHFTQTELDEYKKFAIDRRKAEYLATRLLLQQLLKEKKEIIYQPTGKPQIKYSKKKISISHSADFVAIIVSDKEVGIDVENAQRNIEKVSRRFLHPDETLWIEKSDDVQFLKILSWCAKEAIYKCSKHTGVQFNTQIIIPSFDFKKNNSFFGKLTDADCEKKYKLWYYYFQNNIAVYCVEEQNNYQ
jgi:phosphopantetheinyl transferase